MNSTLHYLKYPLLLLLAGFLLRTFGAMSKILHWRGADSILVAATIVMIAAIIWLMIKISTLKKTKP